MVSHVPNSFDEICRRGSIGAADVAALRQYLYVKASIGEPDAEGLLAIDRACRIQDPAWCDLMVEALTDYLVNDVQPEGYINSANLGWLIARIAPEGAISSRNALELLINLLDKARWSPESLVALSIGTVARGIIKGTGPLRAGTGIEPGHITDADVDLIRRILFAFGGGRRYALTRAEADILLDIQDALSGRPVPPAWTDLLVKSIANIALALLGNAVPRREEALIRAPGLDALADAAPSDDPRLRNLISLDLCGYVRQTDEERALADLERQRIEIITGESVTVGNMSWLLGRMASASQASALATALFVVRAASRGATHPDLEPLLAGIAAAA